MYVDAIDHFALASDDFVHSLSNNAQLSKIVKLPAEHMYYVCCVVCMAHAGSSINV